MDKLNKLRMLAGISIKHTPSQPTRLVESRAAPAPRTRADLANKAAMHLNQAIKALNELDAATARKSDTQPLVDVLNTILENLGQGFDDDLEDPREFAELSADADAMAYGEKGESGVTSPEVSAKIDAYAKEAGLDAEGGEGLGDELPGEEPLGDELPGEEFPDEEGVSDVSDEELADMEAQLSGEDDIGVDDFDPRDMDVLPGDDPGAVGEEEPGYGEDDGEFAEFDESAPAITDKDESPHQLKALQPSPTDDHDRKVNVPSSLKQQLRAEAAQARKEAKELGVTDKDAKWFYEALANMFDELLGHLERGTVYDIKMAQVFMTSLMGPMLHKIPADVVNFVAKGGAERKLADYMKPVDKKYPVTGKMYKGE